MRISEFILKYQGRCVDFDGYYGSQCVDLFRQYVKDVWQMEQPPSVEGAKDFANRYGKLVKIKPEAYLYPTCGDVYVYGQTTISPYGHIAILIEDLGDVSIVFEQDGITQKGARLWLRENKNIIAILKNPNWK